MATVGFDSGGRFVIDSGVAGLGVDPFMGAGEDGAGWTEDGETGLTVGDGVGGVTGEGVRPLAGLDLMELAG
jgi:hypothetical protein